MAETDYANSLSLFLENYSFCRGTILCCIMLLCALPEAKMRRHEQELERCLKLGKLHQLYIGQAISHSHNAMPGVKPCSSDLNGFTCTTISILWSYLGILWDFCVGITRSILLAYVQVPYVHIASPIIMHRLGRCFRRLLEDQVCLATH